MIALFLLLALACLYDYRENRVPNGLLLAMLLAGIFDGISRQGGKGLFCFLIEMAAVSLLLYPLFKIGVLGAGDVKLYGVCAGFLPAEKILFFLFMSLLFAAGVSLFKFVKEQNAIERFQYFCEYILKVMESGKWKLYIENEKDRRASGICLAGPIFCSMLLYLGGAY